MEIFTFCFCQNCAETYSFIEVTVQINVVVAVVESETTCKYFFLFTQILPEHQQKDYL